MRITDNLTENFPFISVISYINQEYIGIIINQDAQVTSMYDYSFLKTEAEQQRLLSLGETWWWESNRQIPINIFLLNDIKPLNYSIRNFATKDVSLLFGPCTSLSDIIVRRTKRKSITLVKRPK